MLLFGALCTGACVLDPPASVRPAPVASVAPAAGAEMPMAVVVITAKRLTPAQKRAEIAAENARAG
jgi:hypothetical protein